MKWIGDSCMREKHCKDRERHMCRKIKPRNLIRLVGCTGCHCHLAPFFMPAFPVHHCANSVQVEPISRCLDVDSLHVNFLAYETKVLADLISSIMLLRSAVERSPVRCFNINEYELTGRVFWIMRANNPSQSRVKFRILRSADVPPLNWLGVKSGTSLSKFQGAREYTAYLGGTMVLS